MVRPRSSVRCHRCPHAGGHGPGRLWLPAGLHIDQDDKIYIADSYNYRVNIYQYLGSAKTPPQDAGPAKIVDTGEATAPDGE